MVNREEINERLKALPTTIPGVQMVSGLSKEGKEIHISSIFIERGERKKGLGTRAIREVQAIAAEIGCLVTLNPSSTYGNIRRKNLITFYHKLGFVENRGVHYRANISAAMYWDSLQVLTPAPLVDYHTDLASLIGKRVAWNSQSHASRLTKEGIAVAILPKNVNVLHLLEEMGRGKVPKNRLQCDLKNDLRDRLLVEVPRTGNKGKSLASWYYTPVISLLEIMPD